jgi:sugar lactone lactonase YvrE
VDREDNFYVVDMTGRVQKFSPDGRFLLHWQMPETELGKAKGLGCDREGRIVVIEPHYQRVNHFSTDGKLVAQWGVRGTNAGEFILPRAVAIGSQGDFFLSEYTVVDRVQRFGTGVVTVGQSTIRNPQSEFKNAWGAPGSGPGEFNRAEGLGVDAQDRVFVADSCNHRIQIFAPDGRFLRAHGSAGPASGRLSYPYDVRVDAAGRQWVCEFGNSRISVFGADDRLIEVIGGAGGAPGQFSNPWGLALDSRGNLYVADAGNHRVQKLVARQQGGK